MKFNGMYKSLFYSLAKNVPLLSHLSLNYDLIDCLDPLLLSVFEFLCTAYD